MNVTQRMDIANNPVFSKLDLNTVDFKLPEQLEANEPPEARGLSRDQVRLLATHFRSGDYFHSQFSALPKFFKRGDVLVINTSATLKAAIPASRENGDELELHLSTRLPAELWIVEVRRPLAIGTAPFFEAQAGERLSLPGAASVLLLTPYRSDQRDQAIKNGQDIRLWVAQLDLSRPVHAYLERYGYPIRYKYVREAWPIEYYQTVYATEPGSAEMPSAGRAFTANLITRLVYQGVILAPLILHTGVASLEVDEPPYEEFYRVPAETARLINAARDNGSRIIAVGTTSVRALESVANDSGRISPGEGWTHLVITPERGLHAIHGLLTGFHEPRSSHLGILSALAGRDHVEYSYQLALAGKYLWHEFGDLHLLLP